MKTHEDPQSREADHSASVVPEGRLVNGGDRPGFPGRSLDRFRLKRSVDCLPTADGSLHLLHEGLEMQYEIDQPKDQDLLVLELLRSGFITVEEICERLNREGYSSETVAASVHDLNQIGVLESDFGRGLLSDEEAERFDRQLIYLADISPEGQSAWQLQKSLRDSHVVVLGCGGLGSWAATGLALSGVGRLTLIDDDTVELSNLNRQLLFQHRDVGRQKTVVAKESLKAINPELRVTTIEGRLKTSTEIAALTSDSDFLVMTADDPPYELSRVVNEACLNTCTPWISAGQIPPLIRVGPVVIPGQTPCLECQERAFSRDFPRYEELIAHRSNRPGSASTLGPASGIVGSLIAMEAVHLLTGSLNPATVGQAMVMDLRTLAVEFESVEPDSECYCRDPLLGAGSSSIG